MWDVALLNPEKGLFARHIMESLSSTFADFINVEHLTINGDQPKDICECFYMTPDVFCCRALMSLSDTQVFEYLTMLMKIFYCMIKVVIFIQWSHSILQHWIWIYSDWRKVRFMFDIKIVPKDDYTLKQEKTNKITPRYFIYWAWDNYNDFLTNKKIYHLTFRSTWQNWPFSCRKNWMKSRQVPLMAHC